MDLIDFIRESNRIEGIGYPTAKEISAHKNFLNLKMITIFDIKDFVYKVAKAKIRNKSGMNVTVGSHFPPPGGPQIEYNLNNLLIRINIFEIDPYKAHCEYEKLHPFNDCNGRSGRAIWLWQMEKLYLDGLGLPFLHRFYYQSLENSNRSDITCII